MTGGTGTPWIVVDTTSGVPPWRQVRDRIGWLAGSGALPVGSPLPSIRQLARDLGLSPGTVARAYRELEEAGVLRTGRRRGTEVAAAVPTGPTPAELLAEAAARFAAAVQPLGVDAPEAVAAVRAALADHRGPAALADHRGPAAPRH